MTELDRHTGTSVVTVKNFLDALAENSRLGYLHGVCQKFDELMSAERGEVKMTVTSAEGLDSRTLSRLQTAVSKSYVALGKKLQVTNKVGPSSYKHGLGSA